MSDSEDKWETIVRIPRNATSELLVRTGVFWNIEVIDIRWYANGKPTRKGVRINTNELPNLMKALIKINQQVNKNDIE